MGHPITLYTSHQLYALLTSPCFILTQDRRTGYEVILSSPELTIQRCNTVNPKGNNVADEAAKRAATETCIGPLLVAEDCEPLTTLLSLITWSH